MPSIADQVATIEHDLSDALAQIDALTAANAALASANASVNRDNIALQLEVNDMKHYVDDTRTMAEQLAGSALDMLRASRRQVGSALPAEVIPFAPNPERKIGKLPELATSYGLDAKIAALPETWPAQNAVHEIMTGDSGDEQPTPGFVAHDLYETGDEDAPDTIKDRNGEVVLGLCRKCGRAEIELADRCDTPLVRDDITPRPPLGPTLVTHNEDKLPIFLTRSQPYTPDRAIFG